MGNIITVEDLESEGIQEASHDVQRVEDLIAYAEEAVESLTGRVFHLISSTTQKADGRSRKILRLRHPAISITKVEIGTTTLEELASAYYEKIEDLDPLKYLLNPRLRRIDGDVWPLGDQNVTVTGDFGFVLPQGTDPETYKAPRQILRAVKLIVARMLTPISERVGDEPTGPIQRERLDDYEYELASSAISAGQFGDREIDRLLNTFRRLAMRAAGETEV